MTDDNSKLVDIDDLDAFEKDFFNGKPVATDEPEDETDEKVEEVEENEDDALATDEDTDADEDTSEDDEPEEEEPKEEPKPKGKKSYQDRINELTAKARNEERRAADLERRLADLEARKPEENKSEPKPRQAAEDAPSPDALNEDGEPLYPLGEFDPRFIRDLTKFTIAQETKAAKEAAELEAEQKQIKAQQDELVSSWAGKVDAAEKELPDLREKLSDMEAAFTGIDPAYGEYLASTIMTCDFGPQIMYYLSQNIGEAQKIVASGPAAATLAIGRLDAKFTKAPAEKRNTKVSAAPKPPESRVRGSGTRSSVAPDTDDLDAFERAFFKK